MTKPPLAAIGNNTTNKKTIVSMYMVDAVGLTKSEKKDNRT